MTSKLVFNSIGDETVYVAKEFLSSLGLDPDRYRENQNLTNVENLTAQIFGVRTPLRSILPSGANLFECSVSRTDSCSIFYINNYAIAAVFNKSASDLDLPSNEAGCIKSLRLYRASLSDGYSKDLLNRFSSLTALTISECDRLIDLSLLIGCRSLKSLTINECHALSDISGLLCCCQLSTLVLSGCRHISKLSALCHLNSLEILDINFCEALCDISAISSLTDLTSLHIGFCDNLVDLSQIGMLIKLESLWIQGVQKLDDIEFIRSLKLLRELHIHGCPYISDLSPLEDLPVLTKLLLGRLDSAECLPQLDIMSQLDTLEIRWCLRIENLKPLSKANSLRSLQIEQCTNVSDLSFISDLQNLEELSIMNCKNIIALEPLSLLKRLRYLAVSECDGVRDIQPLASLLSLERLELLSCSSISNITSFGMLKNLSVLRLTGCPDLSDIEALGKLHDLRTLSLRDCGISNINSLGILTNLESLTLAGCNRIQDVSPVRNITNLRVLDSSMHPGIVSELLAHTAILRNDVGYISLFAQNWLKECVVCDAAEKTIQERLATTLGEAFSLLGAHPIVSEYEAYLDSHPEFSAEPWKAWLIGTYQQSGYEFYRMRVDRLSLSACPPGAIGGVCASLPYGDVEEDQKKWALSWLQQMEQSRSSEFRELLSIAPEICLAYARLDDRDGLERWLLRFTDPSHPGELDAVQSALGKWQLEQGNATQAFGHAVRILSPLLRDALLADIARSCVESDPAMTAEIVLVIELSDIRRWLAVDLAGNSPFVKHPAHVHALIASTGDSPQQLANIVSELSKTADPTIVNELSVLMAATESERCDWVLARLKELETDLTRLKSRLIKNE